MSNNIRTTQPNPDLVTPTGNPERMLRDQDLSICTVYNHKKPERAGSIERNPIYTLDQALSSHDRDGLPPFSRSRAQSAPVTVIPDVQ